MGTMCGTRKHTSGKLEITISRIGDPHGFVISTDKTKDSYVYPVES